MFDVDVHIIHYKEPRWMLDRCLTSLENQPVNIHIIQGVEEWPPYEGRKKGFASGTAKYCSYVDPDDVVKPGAFMSLLNFDGADLIWGNEEVVVDGKIGGINPLPHHAYLIKRGLDIPYYLEYTTLIVNQKISKKHVQEVLYSWNYSLGTMCKLGAR